MALANIDQNAAKINGGAYSGGPHEAEGGNLESVLGLGFSVLTQPCPFLFFSELGRPENYKQTN